MTSKSLIALAATGSLLLLAGAFLFQFAGWPPCELCLWQRWPHAAAVVIGVIALSSARPPAIWSVLGALSVLTTAGLALWHSGIERKLWAGPSSCTASGSLSGDLLSTDGPGLVMCDEIPGYILGLTMANWNVLASAALAVIWLSAARR